MSYRELDLVMLATDMPDFQLQRGDMGTVVHVYSASRMEVEFRQKDSGAAKLILLSADDVVQGNVQPLESGILRGENAIASGETLTHDQARSQLSRWLG